MFDIGFSELMVIAVVALVVLGPERLPKVARTAGHLFGRLQRYVNDVKADINREIELEELRKFRNDFEQAATSIESDIKAEMAKAETSLSGLAEQASVKPELEKAQAEIDALLQGAADPHSPAPAASGESTSPTPATERPEAVAAAPIRHDVG